MHQNNKKRELISKMSQTIKQDQSIFFTYNMKNYKFYASAKLKALPEFNVKLQKVSVNF
jgi:hypothetical protein